jgi:predicted nuclease with TOPRIM domain
MEVMTAMEATPTRWNDDRLDEFARNVDRRFDEVDKRFDKVYKRFDKVDERFDKVDEKFDRMNERFDRLEERFGDLMKALVIGFMSLVGVLLTVLASFVVTQI